MTDALLVADQQIGAGLLPEAHSNRAGFSWQNLSQDILLVPGASSFSGNNSFYGEQTLQGYGLIHHQTTVRPGVLLLILQTEGPLLILTFGKQKPLLRRLPK